MLLILIMGCGNPFKNYLHIHVHVFSLFNQILTFMCLILYEMILSVFNVKGDI